MRRLMLLFAAAMTFGLAVPASAASQPELGVVQNFGPPLAASCHNPGGDRHRPDWQPLRRLVRVPAGRQHLCGQS